MRLMRVIWSFVFAVGLLGCGETTENSLHARVAQGCRSEAECTALHQQTAQRLTECGHGTGPRKSYLEQLVPFTGNTCDTASQDEHVARRYMQAFQEQRRQQEEAWARWSAEQQRVALEQQRAAEEARRAAESAAAQSRRDEEARQQAEADWLALDVKGCAERGERPACYAVETFIRRHPASPHLQEAGVVLRVGRDKIAADEVEQEKRAAAAVRTRSTQQPAAPAPTADPPPSPSGRVRCCDGTLSPTCTYVHRGCCSHHGGVCE